jgi:hypothetical protein
MKNIWLLLFTVVVLSVPSLAQSEDGPEQSGNNFVRRCSAIDRDKVSQGLKEDELVDVGFCLGYIGGIVNGFTAEWTYSEAYTKHKVPRPFCTPDGIERGQVGKILLKFIRENPENAHEPTLLLLTKALRKAYPCVD